MKLPTHTINFKHFHVFVLENIIKKVLYLLESFGFHQDNLEGVIANVSVFDSQPVRAGPQANGPGIRGGEPAGGGQP